MSRHHTYRTTTTWTGNTGSGTSGYRDYRRDHQTVADGRIPIPASSDPGFRGDPARWNPELLLTASLSQCHKLLGGTGREHVGAMATGAQQTAGREEGRCAAVVQCVTEAVAGVCGLQAQPPVEPVRLPRCVQGQAGQQGRGPLVGGPGAELGVGVVTEGLAYGLLARPRRSGGR